MDTVSMIRGNIGRPALKEEERIYFMKKRIILSENGRINTSNPVPFEFVLEATEKGEQLIDAYVGVEFSIIVCNLSMNLSFQYEVTISVNKSGKFIKGNDKFYVAVPVCLLHITSLIGCWGRHKAWQKGYFIGIRYYTR